MRGEAPPDLTPEDLERRRALTAQIDAYVRPYLARNPRAKRAVDALLDPERRRRRSRCLKKETKAFARAG